MIVFVQKLWHKLIASPIQTIYIFAIANSLLIIGLTGVVELRDTASYLRAIESIAQGQIDLIRTPVYPIFLWLCHQLAGAAHYLMLAIILQHLLFLISIYYLFKTCRLLFTPLISISLTVIYAFEPSLTQWCSCIMTESLAVIGIVFLLYTTISMWKRPCWRLVMPHTCCIFLLIFLRPAFIYLLPVMFVAWLIGACKTVGTGRIIALANIALLAGVAVTVWGYVNKFEQAHGVKAITAISTINKYYIVRHEGMIDTTSFPNKDLECEIMESIHQKGYTYSANDALIEENIAFVKKYGLPNVDRLVNTSIAINKTQWIKKCFGRFYRASTELVSCGDFSSPYDTITHVFSIAPTMGMLYVFIFLYLAIIVIFSVNRRSILFTSTLLLMLAASNVIVAIIGAQHGWGRLVFPSFPVYLLMAGELLSLFEIKIKPKEKQHFE